ncbi:MAG: hypothetical protein ACREJC_05510 [Tepidisphaeraceae bacterium]
MPGANDPRKWRDIAIVLGTLGSFWLLAWRASKSQQLGSFDMLKIIASESRTPEEFARLCTFIEAARSTAQE